MLPILPWNVPISGRCAQAHTVPRVQASRLCHFSPMLVDRDRSSRSWSVYQDKRQRWVGLYGSALASMGQQAHARTQGRESGGENLEFRLFCSSMDVQDCKRHFGTQRNDHAPNAPQWSQHRSGARFHNSAKVQTRGQWEAFSSVTRFDKSGRLAAHYHSLAPAPRKAGNTHATCRAFVDNATTSLGAHNCMA